MKEKLKISNRKQKLQILTLIPNSWSVRKANEEFQVSKSTIQKVKILRAEKCIIGYPDTTKRQRLSQELLETVSNIYCDVKFSRNFPGKKNYVSVSKNVHVSKELLLCNVKEIFIAYKSKYQNSKIGFSKSASLRPK